jgi:uncharacterized protein YhaN
MKLIRLNLLAVGPFTGAVLDFSAGDHAIHLVYGANEAGKTSALRALTHLLFGFPHLSADNFVHPNDRLRVGGTLLRSDGEQLELIRRRGKGANTLRGADDSTVIPEDRLARFLGGLERETFATLFGIDHERLTQAGEEIRTGQGHLGELLFAAGAGLAGLRAAQGRLNQELDALFLPRGQKQRINKLRAEFDEAKDELKRCQLPSEEWQQHDSSYRAATSAAAGLREQLRTARDDLGRLNRIKSAIPLVPRHRRLTQELAELRDVVRLRDDFGAESRKVDGQLRQAEVSVARSRAAIVELSGQLEQLASPEKTLEAAGEIEALQERLGAIEKARADRSTRLVNYLDDAEHRARRILSELGRPIDVDGAETLRLRAGEPTMIHKLGQESAKLRGQAAENKKTISRHEDQIRRHEKALADLERPRDVEGLRRAVQKARLAGDLDAWLVEARAKLARAEQNSSIALDQLPGWHRTPEELQRLAVPSGATLDQYESFFEETARAQDVVGEQVTALDDSIRQLETKLRSLELEQDVPTEESLQAARNEREAGWRLVKAAWHGGSPGAAELDAFVAQLAPGGTLAAAYEQSVQRADALADRLRREADRVARRAEWLAQKRQQGAARAELEVRAQSLEVRGARTEQEWKNVVRPLGIVAESQTPIELRAWLRRRDEVLQLLQQLEDARHAIAPLEHSFATHRAAVLRACEEAGEVVACRSGGLAELLEQAEITIHRHDDLAQKRAKLETELAGARRDQSAAGLSLKAAEAELADWQQAWRARMSRIGLEADAPPEQAEVVLAKITELEKTLDERRDFLSRISGIDRDGDQFDRDVAELAARIAPELAVGPSGGSARELAGRLREAQKAATLCEQREREEDNLRAAEAQRQEARLHLERLCKEAGCTEIDQLAQAERRSQDRARVETELGDCDEQLLIGAAGTELAAFTAEVEQASANAEALEVSTRELEQQMEGWERDLQRVDQTIGTERAELARMDGGARALEIAEGAQTLLAQLRGDVQRYATLKLAAAVLHRGIERYREKNQGPILARASTLFATLTSNSFARLQIDDDGDGRSVLKAVRPDGRLVGVDGMSDGSHDQLYLALRLASLESWLSSHEPIPFVVDDILLNFDDTRATAALGALAALGRKTQVLFFTHHRHLIELARAALPRDMLFIHDLPGPN